MAFRIAGRGPIPKGGVFQIGRNELAREMQLKPAESAVIRYYLAGFGLSAIIAAGAAAAPATGPLTRPFHGERLTIPGAIGGAFLLTALASGSDSLFVSAAGAPCLAFSEVATLIGLDFPPTQIGTAITLGVTNVSLAGQVFTALVAGYAAVIN